MNVLEVSSTTRDECDFEKLVFKPPEPKTSKKEKKKVDKDQKKKYKGKKDVNDVNETEKVEDTEFVEDFEIDQGIYWLWYNILANKSKSGKQNK